MDANKPVPLMIQQLRELPAWVELERILMRERDYRLKLLITKEPDIPAATIQRHIGVMEGLNWILAAPDQLEKEWARFIKAQETKGAPE